MITSKAKIEKKFFTPQKPSEPSKAALFDKIKKTLICVFEEDSHFFGF